MEMEQDTKLQIFHERLAEYLKSTRRKKKGEEAVALGVGLTTYLRYESGDPGSLGVNVQILMKIAARDQISITRLVAILENDRLPKESSASKEHNELAKIFRACSPPEIKQLLNRLYELFPIPQNQGEQFSPYVGAIGEYGKWLTAYMSRILLLPIHEIAMIERDVSAKLYRSGKLSKKACNERARVIAVEIEKYLKSRDFTL